MKLCGFALVLALLAGCGDNEQSVAGAPAPVDDAGSSDAAAHVSTGPCYDDPRTTLRFADEALITQDDGVGCYAVYAVFTDHTEFRCPCPDPSACGPALAQLAGEAGQCSSSTERPAPP